MRVLRSSFQWSHLRSTIKSERDVYANVVLNFAPKLETACHTLRGVCALSTSRHAYLTGKNRI